MCGASDVLFTSASEIMSPTTLFALSLAALLFRHWLGKDAFACLVVILTQCWTTTVLHAAIQRPPAFTHSLCSLTHLHHILWLFKDCDQITIRPTILLPPSLLRIVWPWTPCLSRSAAAAACRQYWTVWRRSSLRRPTTRPTSLLACSRPSWTHTASRHTLKSIQVKHTPWSLCSLSSATFSFQLDLYFQLYFSCGTLSPYHITYHLSLLVANLTTAFADFRLYFTFFSVLTRHITVYVGNESFQAIDCACTDNRNANCIHHI